jgi:hypothetical protein
MNINLEEFGLSKDEILEKVANKLCDRFLKEEYYEDEEGEEIEEIASESPILQKLDKMIKGRIDKRVNEIGEKYVLPRVDKIIDDVVLQKTNQWGQPEGPKITFIEYLVGKAENYMTQKVTSQGKIPDGYNRGEQTMALWMINDHLNNEITRAMNSALQEFNRTIGKGITEAVKMKLSEILDNLNVVVCKK